jgi:glycosyltransferase involved in cell wall biosynthesis
MKIAYLSDMDLGGSGYMNLSLPLCDGLTKKGHEVKIIGLSYRREEHPYDFTIIPAIGFSDVAAIIQNLTMKWDFDIFICALDIPHQEKFLMWISQNLPQKRFKYIGIMPVEAGPLCQSWMFALSSMDKAFIISEYGAREAREAKVSHAEHIQIGIDSKMWRIPTEEERKKLRTALGIEEDEFIVLTVADNQERKNPHKLLETYAEFSKGKKSRYILVTREHNPAGARLKDYALELGIINNYMQFERGIPFSQLWGLYAIADAFLLASKAEGLGMPILEAMACGVPVVATNCTAITELLSDGRGLLVDYEYQHRDCFGNGWRYWFNNEKGVERLNEVYNAGFDTRPAREYIEKRTWDIPVEQLDKAISELMG